MSDHKTFAVTFSNGTTRYFLTGKAALRYARAQDVSPIAFNGRKLTSEQRRAYERAVAS